MKKFIFLGFCLILCASCGKKQVASKPIEIDHPAKENGLQPFLHSDEELLQMSWTEKDNDSLSSLYYASYDGRAWSEATKIATVKDMFVNWADFPAISKNENRMIAHYLQKSDSATFAYDVRYLHSQDGGESWSPPVKIHKDSTKTEHGFASYSKAENKAFWAAWLDGRNTAGKGHGHDQEQGGQGAMQLRAAHIDASGTITAAHLIDERTCDCCQTDMAMTSEGPIIAYRDRSSHEVRDIYTSLYSEGQWSSPQVVAEDNWEINGCPVNGPAVDAVGDKVGLSWFTAAGNSPQVKVAFSDNSGRRFAKPIRIDHGKAIGRVDLLLLKEGMALVSWMESAGEEADLLLALVGFDGKVINEWTIGEISSSRSSGFPRMQRFKDRLFVAWNERMEGDKGIKLVQMTLQDIIP